MTATRQSWKVQGCVGHRCPQVRASLVRRRAVTLIELLAVISILSVLVSILLPGLAKVRKAARRTKCMANLKSIGQAFSTYTTTSGGKIPQGFNRNWYYGGKSVKGEKRPLNKDAGLEPQTREAKLFQCPDDFGGAAIPRVRLMTYKRFGTSYNANIFILGPRHIARYMAAKLSEPLKGVFLDIDEKMPVADLTRVYQPSMTILLGDYGWFYRINPLTEPNGLMPLGWHTPGRFNVLMVDGHVDDVRPEKEKLIAPAYRVIPFDSFDDRLYEAQEGYKP